jgi:hypothetical protein
MLSLMTYVDRSLGNHEAIGFQFSIPSVRARLEQAQEWSARSFVSLSSCLSYLAAERGPTASASMLACAGIAAAGTALYESWVDADARRPNPGLVCERGCLRRLSNDVRLKALDEARLHRAILERSVARRMRFATDAPRRIVHLGS